MQLHCIQRKQSPPIFLQNITLMILVAVGEHSASLAATEPPPEWSVF